MPVIEKLMERWGFVKLSRYGLVLTPEGRIISMRPATLGGHDTGRLVGWREDDFPAMDLSSWDASPRPQHVPPASPVAVVPRVATPVPATPALASEPEQPEDDWEWEIALARARIAAEEAEQATLRMTARRRGDTMPPPIAASKPARPTVKPPPVPAPRQTAAPVTIMIPSKSEPIAMISRIVEAAEPMSEDTVRTAPIAARRDATRSTTPATRPAREDSTPAARPNRSATDPTRPVAVDPTKPYAEDATKPYDLSEGTTTRVAAKPTKTTPMRAVEAPKTTPMRVVEARTMAAMRAKTAPMRAVEPPPTRDTVPMATPDRRSSRTMPMQTVAPQPQTVIPVPSLPRVTDGYRPAPVVRTAPRRFATGTQPVAPKTGVAVDPDPTSPSVALPVATTASRPGAAPRR